MKIQKILVRGVAQPPLKTSLAAEDTTELKASFQISGPLRGGAETHEIELKEGDVVELVFEDETRWFANGDTLEDVFPEASSPRRAADGAFQVPLVLRSTGASRGLGGDVMLKALHLLTRKTVGNQVKALAAELEKKQLENFSGLYCLDADFKIRSFTAAPASDAYLLFLHGTASSTKDSFGDLAGTEVWRYIHQTYGPGQVLTFQHETLTKSPLENALELMQQLPTHVTLHLISHSRGGLVGDILARWGASNEHHLGFDENELNYLQKEDRTEELRLIESLKKEFQNRKVSIEKFIRVACPAGGTLLASRRMDLFFNVTLNLLGYGTGLASSPVYTAIKNLIVAVIDSKNQPDLLPGLEAQRPESPFIKALNNPASQVLVDDPLRVVSGNCQLKPNLKALVVLTSKLFFLKDNDLVVNTLSMYQGTKRRSVHYFLDEQANTDHFHYFQNKQTNASLLEALKAASDALPKGFKALPASRKPGLQRQAMLGLEGGEVFQDTVTGTRPIVVLLPGILGSSLKDNYGLLWLNYLRIVMGDLVTLSHDLGNTRITAPSLIGTSYKQLVKYLSASYEVVTFPFDWRLPANRLADALNQKILKLLAYRQPIKIIGHSMGGVLVRDFMLGHPDTWQRLSRSRGFRLLFLGAPLGGSFRIPCVLFGEDSIVNKLSRIDIFNNKKELLQMFSGLPGLLGLLPLTTDPANDFAEMATWTRMRKALGDAAWPLPDQEQLKAFKAYRDFINGQVADLEYANAVYIAGQAPETPCGYRIDQTARGQELVFLSTAEGDQSVTWESGIPKKMIASQSVYYADVVHGSLANEPRIFRAIAQILAKGSTNLLSRNRPVVRGEDKIFKRPLQYDFDLSEEGLENTVLGLEPQEGRAQPATPLRVSVSRGNLRYASHLVLAGHFRHDGILYAEEEIDYNLRRALSERHRLGLYPGEVGSSEIFVSREKHFTGAIIVGLGDFGALTAFQLAQTVEQGVAKYLLAINSKALQHGYPVREAEALGISSLIIGCGYGGLTVESSVRAIIQGVLKANEKIRKLHEGEVKTIQHLEFVELYEDTALNCFYALSRIAAEENDTLRIALDSRRIKTLLGARKRLPAEATAGWWNRITVRLKQEQQTIQQSDIRCLVFSASTGGAREEQRELLSSSTMVEQLVEEISGNNNWSAELAKTVFELLVPNDFKDQLKKHSHISWILDKTTAAYPWELLQDKAGDAKPLCVHAGMIRQLATQDYRPKINMVASSNALVVGEPALDGYLAALPGARQEGELVAGLLHTNGYQTTSCLNANAPEIIQALFRDDYKIIHLAGHGLFDAQNPANSGMVIGKGVFLSTREISQMSTVPELVFVNCCYLGKTDAVAEAYYRSRYKLAANMGTQLIENGVKAVVVAGWAVHDAAALLFTQVFYASMFAGDSFGEAILRARNAVYSKYGNTNNTWGAYQCYGNQYYKFKSDETSAQALKMEFVIAQQAEIELYNLHNELDTGRYAPQDYLERLAAISQAVDSANIRQAAITEKEALIYADLYAYEQAIARFKSLLQVEQAAFSVATLEKYCNIRAKKCAYDFLKAKQQLAQHPQQELEQLSADRLLELNAVIEDLQRLIAFGATAERYSLLGSAYKRKALLIQAAPANEASSKEQAYAQAAACYRQAHMLKPSPYSLTNWYTLESVLVLLKKHSWGKKAGDAAAYLLPAEEEAIRELNQMKQALPADAEVMDYWDMAARANLELCLSLVSPPDEKERHRWDEVLTLYRQLWDKAGAAGKKQAEIEHLQWLADALALESGRKPHPLRPSLRKQVALLLDELEALL